MENRMRTVFLAAAMFVFVLASATGQGKLLTSDPLTGLPLIPATDSGNHIAGMAYTYNEPRQIPRAPVCKSKVQAEFYSLFNIKVGAAVAWYSSHLSGYKKISGHESNSSQTAFYNSDGTIVIIVTGDVGEDTAARSVTYERYQPGISEKTIAALTQGKMVCQ
jgi:hypothetical protein